MGQLVILIVEDEGEVREALERDLEGFCPPFSIESTSDAEEALEVIESTRAAGGEVALILCDHLLPGRLGVDFLVDLNETERNRSMRKVLVTGQASHEDTINAVNRADLHRYIAKPWTGERLVEVVREQLTEYMIAEIEDPTPYLRVLDASRILKTMKGRNWVD